MGLGIQGVRSFDFGGFGRVLLGRACSLTQASTLLWNIVTLKWHTPLQRLQFPKPEKSEP